MSTSRHPIALSLERRVGGATRLLATVMCLPLVDGIFPALVLAGALDSTLGILEVGLIVFGGSATVAVILAEMEGSPREQVGSILAVGVVIIVVAVIEAALAPTIRGLLDLAIFKRFAALVILAVAAKTASARIGELLPRPAIIVVLGLVASFDPSGFEVVVSTDLGLMARAAATGAVAVGFALHVALLGPWLRQVVDLERFRFGSAVALGILPVGLLGLIPGNAPLALAVLGVTFVLAFDPDGATAEEMGGAASDRPDVPAPHLTDADSAVSDGGDSDEGGRNIADDDRAPWL